MTDIKKTLDSATAGSTLKQELVDKVLQDLIERNNPLRMNLPRKPGSGTEWIIIQRSADPTVAMVNDTEEPAASNSTYARTTFPFKTLLSRGGVTRFLEATGKSYIDVEAEEIQGALETVRDKEEYFLIYGDLDTEAKEYDGLEQLIPAGQQVSMGTNGGTLTLAKMDEAIDLCYGDPDMLIMTKRTRRDVNALLQSQQRFVDKVEVKGGFKLLSYMNIPIYWNKQLSDAETQGTAGNATSIFIIDTTKFWVGVLTELTMKRLAITSSQLSKFDIYEDITLVGANEKYEAWIKGIIPS